MHGGLAGELLDAGVSHNVPDSHCLVLARGDHHAIVTAEPGATHPVVVAAETRLELVVGRVPQLDRLVLGAC